MRMTKNHALYIYVGVLELHLYVEISANILRDEGHAVNPTTCGPDGVFSGAVAESFSAFCFLTCT